MVATDYSVWLLPQIIAIITTWAQDLGDERPVASETNISHFIHISLIYDDIFCFSVSMFSLENDKF